jgi:hypothetical protein
VFAEININGRDLEELDRIEENMAKVLDEELGKANEGYYYHR